MPRPYTSCAPALAKELAEIGDRFLKKKHVTDLFTNAGADSVIADKFFEVFHRHM